MTRIKDLPQESISPSGNDWLLVDEIASDSTKKIRLSTISAQSPVQSVAGKTGVVGLTKDDVGLGNVENTTLSTWAGSSNITTIGTLVAGTVPVARISGLAASATTDTTNATNISSGTLAAARLPSVNIGTTSVDLTRASGALSLSGVSIDGNAGTVTNGVYTTGSYSDPSWLTLSKSKVGLGNVENTALSTWGGSTNITTLGTIATGTVPWANVGSKPTTISGYGITDAPTLTGNNTLSGANTITIAAGSAAAPSLFATGDSNTGIYSPGADQLALSTGGTERLFVNANGNVGIGTASPIGKLQVRSAGGSSYAIFTDSTALVNPNNTGSEITGAQVTVGNNLILSEKLPTGNFIDKTDLAIITDSGSGLGKSEKLRITASGNVGIGTASPSSLLDITSPLNTNCTFSLNGSGSFSSILTLNAGGGGGSVINALGGTNYLYLQTNSTSRLIIDSSGNLGLGVVPISSTAKSLQLAPGTVISSAFGNLSLTTNAVFDTSWKYITSSQPVTSYRQDAGTHAWYTAPSGTAGNAISFSQVMTLDASGNLGIGTTSPSTRFVSVNNGNDSQPDAVISNPNSGGNAAAIFDVSSNANAGRVTSTSSAWANYGIFKTQSAVFESTSNFISLAAPAGILFGVGAAPYTEAMRIDSSGYLLVGYTSSNGAYRLQVNSQIFATSSTIATSDGRYKENIAPLANCLDIVKSLNPVSFTWKPQSPVTKTDSEGNETVIREAHNFPEGTQVGFIAQEVEQVLADTPFVHSIIKENVRPEVKDDEGNVLAPEEQFYGIAEGNLIAILTKALQEAMERIESLEYRITALEA